MKKTLLICAVLAFGVSQWCPAASRKRHAVETQNQTTYSTPAATSDDSMQGKFGVGAEIIPGPLTYINALSASYWATDKLDFDGLLGVGSGSYYSGGTNSLGAPIADSTSNFFLGAESRFDIARPTPDLHLQLIGRLGYTDTSANTTSRGTTITLSNSAFGLFVGAGIEGFIPGWRAVSVEVNSGLHIDLMGASAGGTSISESAVYLGGGNGLIPVTLALHYYFL